MEDRVKMQRVVLISTGEDQRLLGQLEAGFRLNIADRIPFDTMRLGSVFHLSRAYHEAVLSIKDPDTLLIFSHQDTRPLFTEFPDNQPPSTSDLPSDVAWLSPALKNPQKWLDITLSLASRMDTGIIGVAGALGMLPETAWWYYPDLSGAVAHTNEGNDVRFNAYGHYGRVAVLDGLCLMLRRGAYDLMGEPPAVLNGFHFYDMDLSLRAHFAGLKNWTVPLLLLHESGGVPPVDQRWKEDHRRFLAAYEDRLPVHVPFEPLPLL